ncbi:TniQ family protein [Endozoicomonas numazuensis]|uniref:TniQ domain-containing protein n=1 Tax=Endozoicomonas numazuensis TaxID=1137799 RepID=A0A081NLT3_9GAMM|nr:TniQ family protein [Endozoicomonas numazuensis]KEQ19406.1 hypothetical protein GZ78_05485 [Endozoicomonas numazuensis]
MLLLSRPKPNIHESLRGYILRLSQENGYHTNQYILELAGLCTGRNYDTASNYVLGDASLIKLSKITNVPIEQLQALRYGLNKEKQSIIHNHKIANEYLRLDYPRVCPICLDTNNIALAIWDIPAITVCPTHHIQLFDHCPECDTRLRWNRPGVHLCHYCECDFRDYTSDKVLLEEYRLSRLIYQLCMNKPVPMRKIPKPLYNHSLADALTLISSIAILDYQLTDEFQKNKKYLSLKAAPNDLLHIHYSRAMKRLDNWPGNFYKLLAENRQVRRKKGNTDGISKEIGAPFYLLKANRHKAVYKPLWDAYCDYRHNATQQTIQEARKARMESDSISIKAAAKELQIRPEQLLKFCKLLKIRLQKGPSLYRFISKERLAEMQSILDKLLTISQAADQLGITVYQLRNMIHKGVITPFRGPTVDKSRDWYINPETIEALKESIRKKSIRSGFRKSHKLNLRQALEQVSYYNLGLPELVSEIIKGKLTPAISGKEVSLGELAFSLEEIKALRPDIQSDSEYWQPPQIQKFLGCKKHVVFGLLNSGQLPLEKINLPGRTRPVVACKKSVVERFKKMKLPLPEIAKKLGTNSPKAMKVLSSNKILPISGPDIDGGYCWLYSKKKLPTQFIRKLAAEVSATRR